MSDLLSHIYDNNTDMLDSQVSQMNNTAGEDFSLSFLDSQSQNTQQFDFLCKPGNHQNQSKERLDIIREEENMGPSQLEIPNSLHHHIISPRHHQSSYNINDKMAHISQEIDDIYQASQRIDSNSLPKLQPIEAKNYAPKLAYNQNYYNNSHIPNQNNFQSATVTLNLQNSMKMNQMPQGGNNHFAKTINPVSNNFNNVKTKTKTNVTYLPNEELQAPSNANSDMAIEFQTQCEEIIFKMTSMMDSIKANFCNFVDNFKNKFTSDAEMIKSILLINTQQIIGEEERNKVIDMRIEALFKDVFNILNEFQR